MTLAAICLIAFVSWHRHKQKLKLIALAEWEYVHIEVVDTPNRPTSWVNHIEIVPASFHPFSYFEEGPLKFGDTVTMIALDGSEISNHSKFLDELSAFHQLESFSITNTNLDESEIEIINSLSSLRGLDVSGTNLSAKSLLDSQSLGTLEYLKLRGCHSNFEPLMELLGKCPYLKRLDISDIGIGRDWRKIPFDQKTDMTLEEIMLDDADAFCLLAHPSISWEIQYCWISEAAINDCFIKALERIKGVEYVSLSSAHGEFEKLSQLSRLEGVKEIQIPYSNLSVKTVNQLMKIEGLESLRVQMTPQEQAALDATPPSLNLKVVNKAGMP